MIIENRQTYAKIKILSSLFSRKGKKQFNIMIFESRFEKIKFDSFLKIMPRNSEYSKKNLKNFKNLENDFYRVPIQETRNEFKKPLIKSMTLNKKEKPITLLYYLKN